MVEINYLAVLVCGIVALALGYAWYGPLFGKQWMALSGMSMPQSMTPEMKKSMSKSYAITFVGALVMAYVLAHSLAFGNAALDMSGIAAGLQGAFWNWLGFVAPAMIGMVLWEGKPWKYYFITAGYYLASLLIMGVILSVWQ
jgi:hypothetical protein